MLFPNKNSAPIVVLSLDEKLLSEERDQPLGILPGSFAGR
jgi:hypothetical protein